MGGIPPSSQPPQPQPSGRTPPTSRDSSKETLNLTPHKTMPKEKTLKDTALRFYDAGFNVIPVWEKKPLVKWSFDGRISREELLEKLGKATGIAVVGGPRDVDKVVLIDIDNPSVLDRIPSLKNILDTTLYYKTGPRCPKCMGKALEVVEVGRRFKCTGCNIEFDLEEAARGLGAIFLAEVDSPIESTFRLGSIEILYKNYQLIPPSLHPTGVRYEWVRAPDFEKPNLGVAFLYKDMVERIIEEAKAISRGESKHVGVEAGEVEAKVAEIKPRGGLRELDWSAIREIVELLKPAYKPGYRQHIILFLSGWLAKAGVSPISTARILRELYELTNDTDPVKERAGAIVYSYKKYGVDLAPYAGELKEILGCEPYGLEREIGEDRVKGRTGLQEVLEEAFGSEEQAVEVVRRLEEILGYASPYRDSIVELLDYDKQIYAVVNLRKLVVVRARRDRGSGRLIYKERVTVGAPTELTVYVNPIGGITKYMVRWEAPTRPKPLIIGPALIEEVVDRLKAEGLILCSRLANDIIPAVVEGFIRRGKAEIKNEIESPGFYFIEGKLTPVRIPVREPSVEEVREALQLLNILAEKWFKHNLDKFATVIKWGVLAPFIYAYKQKRVWVRWLYLYGVSKTGKTTLGEIVLKIWRLGVAHVLTGSSIDTIARLGNVLSRGTMPIMVIEPGGAIAKEEIVEALKASIEGLIARGKYVRGSYVEIPALAPLIFTSNKTLPKDDALLRRLLVVRFYYSERIPEDRAREFEEKVKKDLDKLGALGDFIAWYALKTNLEDPPEVFSVKALEEAYRYAGMEIPSWVYMEYKEVGEEEIYEEIREIVREHILSKAVEAYTRHVGRPLGGEEEADVKKMLTVVAANKLVPWMSLVGANKEYVAILIGIMEELKAKIGDTTLKSLAEILGWEYKVVKVEKHSVKAIVVRLEDLASFLEGVRLE